MDQTPHSPEGSPPPHPAASRPGAALDTALAACGDLVGAVEGGAARRLLGDVLACAIASLSVTDAVAVPLVAAEPGSVTEGLGVLSGIDRMIARLTALDAVWQVVTDQRIRLVDEARDLPPSRQGRGAAAEIALARRSSSATVAMSLAASRRLVLQMPGTLALLSAGDITASQAQTVVTTLDGARPEVVEAVDAEIAGDPSEIDGLGPRRLASHVRELVHTIDPGGSRERTEHAARARRVTARPLPDGMMEIVLIVRAIEGAQVMSALRQEAQAQRARGCADAVGAIEADVAVDAITAFASADRILPEDLAPMDDGADEDGLAASGSASTGAAEPRGENRDHPGMMGGATGEGCRSRGHARRLEVGVIITDRALLRPDNEGEVAHLEGYGAIPAHIVTDTLAGRPPGSDPAEPPFSPPDAQAFAVLRRLYTHPTSGELIGMDSRARAFPTSLERLIRMRDATCRMPWCNARVRHIDHVESHAQGGRTAYDNGQGLCIRCNLLKENGVWTLEPEARPPVGPTPGGNDGGDGGEDGGGDDGSHRGDGGGQGGGPGDDDDRGPGGQDDESHDGGSDGDGTGQHADPDRDATTDTSDPYQDHPDGDREQPGTPDPGRDGSAPSADPLAPPVRRPLRERPRFGTRIAWHSPHGAIGRSPTPAPDRSSRIGGRILTGSAERSPSPPGSERSGT